MNAPCEMLFIIYLLISFGETLPINGSDALPATISSHCFKKISGGERLINYDVTRIIERNTVEECEEECNIYKCTHFSFGRTPDKNNTCELTTDREISRTQDPNFDLYQRTYECAEGKPTGYEKACYRRIITGRRLHERFIRHSLPCNSLQACQHQCSIEKHFTCQGFNIRLDPARVGRGICELSSIETTHLDPSRDFVFDPEFAYYERNHDNNLANCGHFSAPPNTIPPHNPEENTIGYQPPLSGGPYYGGDSYGPWSTGHGTVDHGPWGSHGYGSGLYESNNPSKRPFPHSHPDTSVQQGPYSGYGYGYSYGYGSGSRGYGFPEESLSGGSKPAPPPNVPFQPGPHVYGGEWHNFKFNTDESTFGGPRPFLQPNTPGHPVSSPGYGGESQIFGFSGRDGHRKGSRPSFQSNTPNQQDFFPTYGHGYGYGYGYGYGGRPQNPKSHGGNSLSKGPGPYGYGSGKPYPTGRPTGPEDQERKPTWGQGPPIKYPTGDNKYGGPNRNPTYIIIDADVRSEKGGAPINFEPRKPSAGYLPIEPPSALPRFPHRPPPRLPQLPPRLFPSSQEPRLPLPLYPFAPEGSEKLGIPSNTIGREVCFRREHPGYRLNANTIRRMYETPTVLDCEALCTNSPFTCTGYSFRYSSSENGPNCLLTDYTSLNPETHLLPDRSCDVYFKMSTCMESDRTANTECFLKVATNRKLDTSKLVKMLSVTAMPDCELACLNSGFFTCRSFSFRHGPPVIGEPVENCFLSDWPISGLTHLDFVPFANHEVYERGSFGHGCELDVGPPHIGPRPPLAPYPNIPQITHSKDPWGLRETWQHFTVNGWPCRSGTECELNSKAGFWTCEVEGGDRAQWDYCCRPKHSCGFSRGYSYPWCYVGEAGPDQWRPCSKFYYPEFGNRYPHKPVHNHNPHPEDSYGLPKDTRPWNFGAEFGPPTYWPISYIYAEPPPNETHIWDPEEHTFYYQHDEQHEPQPPEHYFESPEDSPRIRFKSCGNRHSYPRAIIQKLDLKSIPKAGNPEEQSRKDERPKVPKVESEHLLGFSPENRDKKNSLDLFDSGAPILGNLTERDSNGTKVSLNKTKEVIKEVEKIIMESSTAAETEKNETLKKVETKHPGLFSLSLLEKPDFWN